MHTPTISDPDIAALQSELIARRRALHRQPELGFQEVATAQAVMEGLAPLALEVRTGVAKTGVVATLYGARPGKTVLIRADMDALPIQEQITPTNHDYASRNPGVMHACGHDAHTAMLLAVARVLSGRRDRLAGNVKFVFQPAEEGPGGAAPMIAEGVLEDPGVDIALGFHVWNNQPVGTIGVVEGPCMACTDQFRLVISGKGGHGAMPHLSVDAIAVAAQVISALQLLVSRETSPIDSAVLTLGTIQGGYRHNVIADQVVITGTVRTFTGQLAVRLPRRIREVVAGITRALGADFELDYQRDYPATVNDPAVCALVREAAAKVVGPEQVIVAEPSMGGEDMAYFLQAVPGCYFFVGSANPEKGLTNPHHHPGFDFDEAAMPLGVAVLVEAVERYLS